MDGENIQVSLESPFLEKSDRFRLTRYGCTEIITELKKQMQLAGPLVLVTFLQFSLLMIAVMFVGHLGEFALAGASMAVSFANVTGFSIMIGAGSALETFCGQAYGAKQQQKLGMYTQKAMLVLSLTAIPIAVLWSLTEKIFVLVGQDAEISTQAGVYIRWLIPGILPFGLLQCQIRFLQSQSNLAPLILSSGATSLIHLFVCWKMVAVFGFEGAALSTTISYWTNVLILAVYIKFSASCRKTWTGFSMEGMKDLTPFLKLGVPSALMVCLEYWAFEVLLFMSGLFPNPKLQTSMMSISFNTCCLAYRIPFGFSNAVSTRVSNELGAQQPRNARLAVYVVIAVAVVQGLVLGIAVVLLRNVWGYLYTEEVEVIQYLASVMPFIAIANFMDGIQGVLQGAIRGCGWQKRGVIVDLGAYYLVGIPCSLVLAFPLHLGGKGFWIGIACASTSHSCLLLTMVMFANWKKEAEKAKERLSCGKDCM